MLGIGEIWHLCTYTAERWSLRCFRRVGTEEKFVLLLFLDWKGVKVDY